MEMSAELTHFTEIQTEHFPFCFLLNRKWWFI